MNGYDTIFYPIPDMAILARVDVAVYGLITGYLTKDWMQERMGYRDGYHIPIEGGRRHTIRYYLLFYPRNDNPRQDAYPSPDALPG